MTDMTAEIQQLVVYFDDRYVKKGDCADRHEQQTKEMTELKLNQERNTTKLNIITKIDIAILTASITLLASQIGHLIFK